MFGFKKEQLLQFRCRSTAPSTREPSLYVVPLVLIPCPTCDCPTKMLHIFAGALFGGQGGIVNAKSRAGRTIPQSLRDSSLYTREPFLCHPEHGTQWNGGIPLQVI